MSWPCALPGSEKCRALIARETGQHTLHQLRRSSAQSPGELFKRHLLQTATQDAAEVRLIKDQQIFKLERIGKRCLHPYLYEKIFCDILSYYELAAGGEDNPSLIHTGAFAKLSQLNKT